MEDPLASVVIPVAKDADFLGQCLDRVLRQDFDRKEVIVVCDPSTGALPNLPKGSEELKVIREQEPCSLGHLINRGMCAARGHVKVLLMPHCVPAGNDWMSGMVRPFENDEVGVDVSQCTVGDLRPGLPVRLLSALDPPEKRNDDGRPRRQHLVSHLCDGYRASLLADIGYFEDDLLATPGEAVDVSLKVADAGYSIVLSDSAKVACNIPSGQKKLSSVLGKALDYGYSDAVLDKMYDLHWLNSSVFAAALLALFLLPLGALKLPLAAILAMALLAWGWLLSVRVPLLGWDCPMVVVNCAVYIGVMFWLRDGGQPQIFGTHIHPAILRQWCLLATIVGTYSVLLIHAGARAARRACTMSGGIVFAVPVFVLAMAWWLAAGVGYMRGLSVGRASKD